MLNFRRLLAACFTVLSLSLANIASAGLITTVVVEDKGEILAGVREVPSVFRGAIIDEGMIRPIQFVLPNLEIVFFPRGVHLYNIYAASIRVPQPIDFRFQLVEIYWLMAADTGNGIGPLPFGSEITAATMFGLDGSPFAASITAINDLANLPTSSLHDLNISWDLSALASTTGNFYLMQATIPFRAMIPEPAALALLVPALLGLRLGKKRRSSLSHV